MALMDPDGPSGKWDDDTRSSGGRPTSSPSSSKTAPKKKSKLRDAIGSAGQSLNERSVDELRDIARDAGDRVPSLKRGGTFRKNDRNKGVARLHKSERVMPKRKKAGRMSGRS
jgi:hypothetical protein